MSRPRKLTDAERRQHKQEYTRRYKQEQKSNPEYLRKNREQMKKWHLANPERTRELVRKSMYGVTPAQFRDFLVVQNDACAGCGIGFDEKKPCVDHDHTTGKVRGLLCRDCNYALGFAKDSLSILRGLMIYLERDK